MFFTPDKIKYDLSVLVEYVAKALYDTNRAFVRYSTFSLVNVLSPIAHLSYGLAPPPHETLRRFHPLAFTFAFTSRDTYPENAYPKFSIRPLPQTHIWGMRFGAISDYITIQVPKRVMREAGLLVPNIRELKWLYMAIGAWSKGFVWRPDFYDANQPQFHIAPIDARTAYSQHYYRNMQSVFKYVPYSQWGYSKEMWQLAPNFLHPHIANDDFIEFYCQYLASDYYGRYSQANNVRKIEGKVEDYVRSGLIDLISIIGTPNASAQVSDVQQRNMRTVLTMLGGMHSVLSESPDIEELTRKILRGEVRM